MATPIDGMDPINARKARGAIFKITQQLELMRDAVTTDNTTIVAAMTSASGQASLAAAQASLATAISDANTQAADRVAAVNVEISKIRAALYP